MKLASTYLYRPLLVHAIQLPAENEEPTEEWKASLHELLVGVEWESGRNGELAFPTVGESGVIAEPGDWIVRERSSVDRISVLEDIVFKRKFIPAELAAEHRALEAERFSNVHLTTP